MTFDEYQELTEGTAIYGASIEKIAEPGTKAYDMLCKSYVALGLGEAGEIQGKVKKLIRDAESGFSDETRSAIKKELGDQLWYIARNAKEYGLSLDEVAQSNIDKLYSRKERGVLQGSGDDR